MLITVNKRLKALLDIVDSVKKAKPYFKDKKRLLTIIQLLEAEAKDMRIDS